MPAARPRSTRPQIPAIPKSPCPIDGNGAKDQIPSETRSRVPGRNPSLHQTELVHAIPEPVHEPGYAQEPDRPWPDCRYDDEGKSAQQLKSHLTGPPILQAVSDVDSRGHAEEDRERRAAIPPAEPADQGSVDGASDSTKKDMREKRHSSPLKPPKPSRQSPSRPGPPTAAANTRSHRPGPCRRLPAAETPTPSPQRPSATSSAPAGASKTAGRS
jgi:hypothetical protein